MPLQEKTSETKNRGKKRKAASAKKTGSAKKQKTGKKKQKTGKKKESVVKTSMRDMERRALKEGYKWVIGTDEAGRGPLAGPVVAGACRLPMDVNIPGIYDSKQTTEEQREELYEQLVNHPQVTYGVCILSHETIDDINILNSAMLGMRRSTKQVMEKLEADPKECYLLIDGPRYPVLDQFGLEKTWEVVTPGAEDEEPTKKKQKSLMSFFNKKKTKADPASAGANLSVYKEPRSDAECVTEVGAGTVLTELERIESTHGPKSRRTITIDWIRCVEGWVKVGSEDEPHLKNLTDGKLAADAVIKGDAKCYCIAAASIIAKVTRDRIMKELAKKYPEYGLENHMGYGTKMHREAVAKHGPSEIHRRSFKPVKTMVGFERARDEYMEAYAAMIDPFVPKAGPPTTRIAGGDIVG